MSKTVPPVAHPPVRNALHHLATSLVVLVATAFLFLALTIPARSAPPPAAPNPSFTVGTLVAYPTLIQIGHKPSLQWSTNLPPGTNTGDYTFFIRQKMIPAGFLYDMPVEGSGATMAAVAINPGFATFELWTVKATQPPRPFLLDSTTIGSYLPIASVKIVSEDPYSVVPRTRADRPFSVQVTVNGIISDPQAPEASKSVTLMRHVQPYGPTGTGDPLDRTLATLQSQSTLSDNGSTTTAIPLTEIPGTDRAKVRGEERFSIFTRQDTTTDPYNGLPYNMPPYHLDSQFVQIWPVADATITGIHPGKVIGTTVPQLTFQLDDLYPASTTWAQVYPGTLKPDATTSGTTLPGSTVVINDSVPANRTLTLSDYASVFSADGLYTIELVTQTPFGIDRLAHITFTVQRTTMTASDWRQFHFASPGNGGDGADNNDFDLDGIPNLIEFAYALDPKQNSAGLLPVPQRIGDDLAIRFTPPDNIAGIHHGVQWSTTLEPNSWTRLTNTGTAPEQVFTIPTTGKPRLYLRLTADLVAP